MSQARARFMPAPAAAPFTAAINGLGESRMSSTVRSREGATRSRSGRARPAALASCMALTSPPAQKPLPAPVMTITRTSASSIACVSAAIRSSRRLPPSALRRSGRFSVSVATWSFAS